MLPPDVAVELLPLPRDEPLRAWLYDLPRVRVDRAVLPELRLLVLLAVEPPEPPLALVEPDCPPMLLDDVPPPDVPPEPVPAPLWAIAPALRPMAAAVAIINLITFMRRSFCWNCPTRTLEPGSQVPAQKGFNPLMRVGFCLPTRSATGVDLVGSGGPVGTIAVRAGWSGHRRG